MRPSRTKETIEQIGEEFKKLYLEDKLSKAKIASHFNICEQSVNKIINYLNLKRDRGEVTSKVLSNNDLKLKHFNDLVDRVDKEKLIKYYIEEDHGYYDTIKHFNITDWSFCKLLQYYNIDKKDKSKVACKAYGLKAEELGGKENYHKYRLERRNKGIIEKYGSLEAFYKIKASKSKETWEKNYYEILNKINSTKEQNNSFHTSNPEDIYYKYLLTKFKEVKRQYRDDRYPFKCDFYIPEKDLFIELNFNWTHGYHPYNEELDKETLERWKLKSLKSKYYENAIHTWTELDVEKFKIAKENDLKYLTFYNEEEAYSYFEGE